MAGYVVIKRPVAKAEFVVMPVPTEKILIFTDRKVTFMKTIIVKELMVPLKDYATVLSGATLLEAVLVLEQAQMTLDTSMHNIALYWC